MAAFSAVSVRRSSAFSSTYLLVDSVHHGSHRADSEPVPQVQHGVQQELRDSLLHHSHNLSRHLHSDHNLLTAGPGKQHLSRELRQLREREKREAEGIHI